MARAIGTAQSGRPGPVHVALPFDVLEGDVDDGVVPAPQLWARERSVPGAGDTAQITQALATAKAPLILCGPVMNATRAGDVLDRLSAAMDAPVVAMESPRGLKDPALGDFRQALARADVVLSLGKPVNYTLGFGASTVFAPGCWWLMQTPSRGTVRKATWVSDLRSPSRLIRATRQSPCAKSDQAATRAAPGVRKSPP